MERNKGIGLYVLVFLAGFLVASVVGPQIMPPAKRLEAATPPIPPPLPQDDRESAAPPVLGAPEGAGTRVDDIGQRLLQTERRLADLEKRFAKHTHEFAGFQPDRVAYYENFVRYPETYRNALIPYRVGAANRPTTASVTGPPRY